MDWTSDERECLSKGLQQQLHRLQPLVPDKVLLHTGHSSTLFVHNSQAAQETRQVSRPFNTREAPGSAWGAPAYTPPPPEVSAAQPNLSAVHGLRPTAALVRQPGELGFRHRSIAQRRRPIEERGRLLELRCRARPRLPSITTHPAQYSSPHVEC